MIKLISSKNVKNAKTDGPSLVSSLIIPMSIEESRMIGNVAILKSVFINKRHDDSYGQELVFDTGINKSQSAVFFTNKDLQALLDTYQNYCKVRIENNVQFSNLEILISAYLKHCLAEGLEVISYSYLDDQVFE